LEAFVRRGGRILALHAANAPLEFTDGPPIVTSGASRALSRSRLPRRRRPSCRCWAADSAPIWRARKYTSTSRTASTC
jgi:hypothetical protein